MEKTNDHQDTLSGHFPNSLLKNGARQTVQDTTNSRCHSPLLLKWLCNMLRDRKMLTSHLSCSFVLYISTGLSKAPVQTLKGKRQQHWRWQLGRSTLMFLQFKAALGDSLTTPSKRERFKELQSPTSYNTTSGLWAAARGKVIFLFLYRGEKIQAFSSSCSCWVADARWWYAITALSH